jgi:hypothetical protein
VPTPHVEIETPHGLARAHLKVPERPRAALVLGHGAGGGIQAPDLLAAARAAGAVDIAVALVEQPYRVAGRRSPVPARQLDASWLAVVERLRMRELAELPLVVGGRSSGARVACRSAGSAGAVAVLCLAFPLHPPGRPHLTRVEELDAVTVPTLVVQGERDPFGMPPASPSRTVVVVDGDHSLKAGVKAVEAAVRSFLATTS